MSRLSLTFHAHQPNRLIPYDFFKIGEHAFYEDDELNARMLNEVTERCYLPANRMIMQLISMTEGQFRCAFVLSGVILEQARYHRPDLIASFQELADTGCVEFLATPYYGSLASIYNTDEFAQQVNKQLDLMEELFDQRPKVLWNTGMLYSNAIAAQAYDMGLTGIMASGNSTNQSEHCNNVYCAPLIKDTKTLIRNRRLSNDLTKNRTNPDWEHHPLSPTTFSSWISAEEGQIVNISLDYETIGEHQSDSTGVFEFWRSLVHHLLVDRNEFLTPSEAVELLPSLGTLDCPNNVSCTAYGTTSQWNGNVMQQEAIRKINALAPLVKASNDPDMIHVWRKLQSADHFHYMDKENSFTPYPSPYEAYIYYMNALADLQVRVKENMRMEKVIAESNMA